MTYEITLDGKTRVVTVDRAEGGYTVRIDGGPALAVDARRLPSDTLSLRIGERSIDAVLTRREGGFDVNVLGTPHSCEVVDPRRKALRQADGAQQGLLTTSMPGRVVSVLVEQGARVERGQSIVVVEAMKMENELKAPCNGTVSEIMVRTGQAVEANAKLVRVTPEG